MKVLTVVGTRPELIRLSAVIRRLDATQGIEHILVHTGQNYDYALNEVFFRDLGIRRPNHYLGVDTKTLGSVLGGVLIGMERVLHHEGPDAMLVLGDTNSCLAAIMAKRMRIPTYHMEAGNRCFDENVPEETNRRIVDHTADFNLAYTEHARRNLLAEGLQPRRVIVTGSPMREVLQANLAPINESKVLESLALEPGEFFLVSCHREENVDNGNRLRSLIAALIQLRREFGRRVIVSTHPRTQKRLAELEDIESQGVEFLEPFGFHDYNKLQMNAACVLSDSGTIAEESAILGFPAITLRDSIERPEALDAGTILMTGVESQSILTAVRMLLHRQGGGITSMPMGYEVTDTSNRVVNFIMSTAPRHHAWAGIRQDAP